MPRPTARVLTLLAILQAGGTFTVADLAERLDVDERTLRRYATHLTELGIPVEARRGRYGGYRLGPGYKLPPLMLTDDETEAVLLGLRYVDERGDDVLATAAENARAKRRLDQGAKPCIRIGRFGGLHSRARRRASRTKCQVVHLGAIVYRLEPAGELGGLGGGAAAR